MSNEMQFNISHVLQGVVLAAVLWVGSSITDLSATVKVNDWRLDRIEQKLDKG